MKLKKYWVFIKAEIQKMLEYRGDMIIWTLSSAITPLVGLAIWMAISSSGAQLIFNKSDLIIYFIAIIWVEMITSAWGSYFIQESIFRGEFSKYLIRPFTLIEEYLANNLSEKFFKLIITTCLTIILFILLHKSIDIIPITFLSVILFLPSLFMAFCIAFLFNMIIGISTFWIHDNDFIKNTFSLFDEFFSGKIIPIAFLPLLVFGAAQLLPFRYILSFPVEVLLNKVTGIDLFFGFVMQILWFLFVVLTYRILYAKGIKIYQGYGG